MLSILRKYLIYRNAWSMKEHSLYQLCVKSITLRKTTSIKCKRNSFIDDTQSNYIAQILSINNTNIVNIIQIDKWNFNKGTKINCKNEIKEEKIFLMGIVLFCANLLRGH